MRRTDGRIITILSVRQYLIHFGARATARYKILRSGVAAVVSDAGPRLDLSTL